MYDKSVVRSMFPQAYAIKADDGNWDVWTAPGSDKTIAIGGTEKEAWEIATYWVQAKRSRGRVPI